MKARAKCFVFDSLLLDHQMHPTDKLPEDAKAQLAIYVDYIKNASNSIKQSSNPSQDTARWMTELFRLMFTDMFEAYQLDRKKICVCISGSIAKLQATQYSDVDSFAIYATDADESRMKPYLVKMINLIQRVEEQTNQFCPDLFGMNVANCNGTIPSLIDFLNSDKCGSPSTYVNTMQSAVAVLGRRELLTELQTAMNTDKQLRKFASPNALYEAAVIDFKGPPTAGIINLKRDCLRPIDFILAALRREYGFTSQDYSHVKANKTIAHLISIGAMSNEMGDLILEILSETTSLRKSMHESQNKESDDITLTAENTVKIRNIIDKVAIVRGVAAKRLQLAKGGFNTKRLVFKVGPTDKVPYISGNHFKAEHCLFDSNQVRSLDPTVYVYDNISRQYFSNIATDILINKMTLNANLNPEGYVSRLVNEVSLPGYITPLLNLIKQCINPNGDIDEETFDEKFAAFQKLLLHRLVNDFFDTDGNLFPELIKVLDATGEQDLNKNAKMKAGLLQSCIVNVISPAVLLLAREIIHSPLNADRDNSMSSALISRKLNNFATNISEQSLNLSAELKQKNAHFRILARILRDNTKKCMDDLHSLIKDGKANNALEDALEEINQSLFRYYVDFENLHQFSCPDTSRLVYKLSDNYIAMLQKLLLVDVKDNRKRNIIQSIVDEQINIILNNQLTAVNATSTPHIPVGQTFKTEDEAYQLLLAIQKYILAQTWPQLPRKLFDRRQTELPPTIESHLQIIQEAMKGEIPFSIALKEIIRSGSEDAKMLPKDAEVNSLNTYLRKFLLINLPEIDKAFKMVEGNKLQASASK